MLLHLFEWQHQKNPLFLYGSTDATILRLELCGAYGCRAASQRSIFAVRYRPQTIL